MSPRLHINAHGVPSNAPMTLRQSQYCHRMIQDGPNECQIMLRRGQVGATTKFTPGKPMSQSLYATPVWYIDRGKYWYSIGSAWDYHADAMHYYYRVGTDHTRGCAGGDLSQQILDGHNKSRVITVLIMAIWVFVSRFYRWRSTLVYCSIRFQVDIISESLYI